MFMLIDTEGEALVKEDGALNDPVPIFDPLPAAAPSPRNPALISAEPGNIIGMPNMEGDGRNGYGLPK